MCFFLSLSLSISIYIYIYNSGLHHVFEPHLISGPDLTPGPHLIPAPYLIPKPNLSPNLTLFPGSTVSRVHPSLSWLRLVAGWSRVFVRQKATNLFRNQWFGQTLAIASNILWNI